MLSRELSSLPRPRSGLQYRRLVDGAMLYDPTTERVHHFNLTAALVWERCGEGVPASEIAAELSALYEVESISAAEDVERLVDDFLRQRLLGP